MAPWDGLNRRKFPRVKCPCLVTLRNPDDALLTHTENLGVGGVGVIIKKNIKMFTMVDLEIDLMDFQDHIKCQGKVVWSIRRREHEKTKPLFYDIGIEFVDLDPKEIRRLEHIIQHLAKTRPEVIV
jgi:Tfp pilus assembly protein PilZ